MMGGDGGGGGDDGSGVWIKNHISYGNAVYKTLQKDIDAIIIHFSIASK